MCYTPPNISIPLCPKTIKAPVLIKAMKKALKVPCRYKISAIGYNKRFELLGISTNSFRDIGGDGFRGIHAEEKLMQRYGKLLSYILIVRTNKQGDVLPIKPCDVCQAKANKLGIKIISLAQEFGFKL